MTDAMTTKTPGQALYEALPFTRVPWGWVAAEFRADYEEAAAAAIAHHIATQEQGKDAARLDWLEAQRFDLEYCHDEERWGVSAYNTKECLWIDGPTPRAAIDAAMAAMSPASSRTDEGEVK